MLATKVVAMTRLRLLEALEAAKGIASSEPVCSKKQVPKQLAPIRNKMK